MLKINDKMPNFEILTDKGEFKISNYLGKKIVIFFFPKADTSGCTAESIAFTNLQKEFDQLNCIVIGISKDNPKKQVNLEKNIILLVSLVLILKIMSVNSLEFGLKNQCMEENIWEYKELHFCQMKKVLLLMFGKKLKFQVMQKKY